jgi:streptomycin 6-kinase
MVAETLLPHPEGPLPDTSSTGEIHQRCAAVRKHLIDAGLYQAMSDGVMHHNNLWRIATEPFQITPSEFGFIE